MLFDLAMPLVKIISFLDAFTKFTTWSVALWTALFATEPKLCMILRYQSLSNK